MAEARLLSEWDHTAAIVATLENIHRAKGSRPVKPAERNPYRVARRQRQRTATVEQLTNDIMRLADSKRGRR